MPPRSATRPLSLLLLTGAIAIAVATPAQAFTPPIGSNKGSVITYNGHAGLGANISDGTSNTIMFGERFATPD
jgi:hypothetical protein